MKISVFILAFCLWASHGFAQKNYTKGGTVTFYSKAPLENIEAVNKTVTAILDTHTGTLLLSVLMRGFEFEKALMQEHFNENYVESDKYPKATFTGMVQDNNRIAYTKDGSYDVTVKGKMQFHGVSKDVEVKGMLVMAKGVPQLTASFPLALADYKITIPSLVADKISQTVKVTVLCVLDNVLP